MLTQKEIYEWDGKSLPVKNRPIRIMDPTPGNGWGCLPPVDIIKMFRRLAEEQGKAVEVIEVRGRPRWARFIAQWTLILTVISFMVGLAINWVK